LIQINEHISLETTQYYLDSLGLLLQKEQVNRIEKAGEGNMNVVLRITTNQRSIILKQSRPFVQKYQDIPAPMNRILVEHQFYTAIRNRNIDANIPSIIFFDSQNHLLVLEDLGNCKDMSLLYSNGKIENQTLEMLVSLLSEIHETPATKDFPDNMEMRKLNHQHIFTLPFMEDNGFSLDNIQQGLQELSISYKQDEQLKNQISIIGEKYLSKGNTLLHGDYYPGSWMTDENQIYVIDPEFGFVGFAEFDIGVMAAHLIIATHDPTYIEKIQKIYPKSIDIELLKKISGIEIMRRLIGLAQLPLSRTLAEKEQLLLMSKNMILS
tara:strand:+ start:150 stop:1121 length:972 start_codon:yes stop_codon:yes gene_type:complete